MNTTQENITKAARPQVLTAMVSAVSLTKHLPRDITTTQENITKAAHGAAMLMWDLYAAYESARQGTVEILFADALRRAAELNAQIAVIRDAIKEESK